MFLKGPQSIPSAVHQHLARNAAAVCSAARLCSVLLQQQPQSGLPYRSTALCAALLSHNVPSTDGPLSPRDFPAALESSSLQTWKLPSAPKEARILPCFVQRETTAPELRLGSVDMRMSCICGVSAHCSSRGEWHHLGRIPQSPGEQNCPEGSGTEGRINLQ